MPLKFPPLAPSAFSSSPLTRGGLGTPAGLPGAALNARAGGTPQPDLSGVVGLGSGFGGGAGGINVGLPPFSFNDNFRRANGGLGQNWQAGAGWAISSNAAVNTPTPGADVVVNGAFGADTDWNKGAGWTIAAGTAVATAASSDITAAVAPLTVGAWYQTAFTQGGFAAGTANVKLGSTAFPTHTTNATFTETGLALTTALAITGVGLTDTVDNFSAKPITLTQLLALINAAGANFTLSQVTTMGAGIQGGLALNWDSQSNPANGVLAVHDTVNAYLYKCVAGTWTAVISGTAITYGAANRIKVIKSGTAYSLYYGTAGSEAQVGTTQAISDVGIINNTLFGLFATTAGVSFGAFALG